MLQALVDEVTVVGPGFCAIEPRAEVLSIRRTEPEVIYGTGQRAVRYFENAVIAVR